MPRQMSSAMLAAIQAPILFPSIFVSMGFENETLYVWSGVGNQVWNGQTYTGVGSFGGVSVIEEGTTVDAKGITLTLSGIDPTMLAEALQNLQLGLPVTVSLALWTGRPSAGGTLISSPLTAWQGTMDQPEITVSGQFATITIKCESQLLQLNVPCDRRYTQDDIQLVTPGDLGFFAVDSLQQQNLYWGTSPTATQNI